MSGFDHKNNDYKLGEIVNKFNVTFEWTQHHIDSSELEKLRWVSDPLVDNCLPFLKPQSNKKTNDIKVAKINNDFRINLINELNGKEDCPNAIKLLYNHFHHIPEWVDWNQIKRGQELFWSYFPLCSMVLLNHSLVGGFAAGRIVATLQCTGYLTKPELAWDRLMETALMVMDCMSYDQLRPNGRGWKSALNVRFMHAQVRKHVSKLPQDKYDVKKNGIPINQEDLLSTLSVFSLVVLEGLSKFHISLSNQQKEDYLATWRYIGYLIGVDDKLNYFESYIKVKALRESLLLHITEPNTQSGEIALSVLKASANKPPFYKPLSYQVELSRLLIGDKWANTLNLPTYPLVRHYVWFNVWLNSIFIRISLKLNKEMVIETGIKVGYKQIHRILGTTQPNYQFKPLTKSTKDHLPFIEAFPKTFISQFFNPIQFMILIFLLMVFLTFNLTNHLNY